MNKKISIIGIGKLGICLSLNLEKHGYDVIGVDVDEEYVKKINSKNLKSDEPFVEEYLNQSKNFIATTDIKKVLSNNIIFITVATPSLESGRYDHSQIENVITQILECGIQDEKKYLVINCTTMPTFCEKLNNRLQKYNYEVCYNPEFIAQGSIIKDQVNPDTVLIGCYSNEAYELISDIYKKICNNKPSYYKMSTTEAEIMKIALNCFLTTKISYANMVGDIAKKVNCDPSIILKAIGSDTRIGHKYLKYGFGFGGPCFPRDNRAFGLFCEEHGIYPHISYATDLSNKSHLLYQVQQVLESGITSLTIDTVTYKPESSILEESQKLKFALELCEKGINVSIIEKEKIIDKLKQKYGNKFNYIIK